MTFRSILGAPPGGRAAPIEEPAFFADLNLDRVVAAVTGGREHYALRPVFWAPPADAATVRYRHEVVRDLQREAVSEPVRAFARDMGAVREHLALAETLRHPLQASRWFLDAVAVYCDAVVTLAGALEPLELGSRGFRSLREYLRGHTGSAGFASRAAETRELRDRLGRVRYALHIRGSRVTVGSYEGEADYGAEVEQTFARFRQGDVKDHRVRFSALPDMDHVEARVLELVARLHPDVFRALGEFPGRHRDFVDPVVGTFDREVQFYLAYLEHIAPLEEAGLPFCLPDLDPEAEEILALDAFDLALAGALASEGRAVVGNDVVVRDPERILVVTGPNQGGKTTFARTFGQLHHLAGLGLPVPAREARLLLPDRLFTHFEREEHLETLRGKLEDELVRIHEILERATSRSVIVMNESFSSTTLADALAIGAEVLTRIAATGALGVCVTFIDELASLGEATVSMVATVEPDGSAARTYRIVRQPADGLAYAAALAERYGLSYAALTRRLAR